MDSGNSRAYLVGVSHIVVGTSAVSEIKPRSGVLSGFLEIHAAGNSGVVALVNGASYVGLSGTTNGYQLRANDKVELEGPAKFYLAASGNAVTVSYVMRLTAGATIG